VSKHQQPSDGAATPLDERIAQLAHACWCASMHQHGWSSAQGFDAALHTHDALVPFAQLDPVDRAWGLHAVAADHTASNLARLLDYPRGNERPFRSGELRVGLPVAWASHVQSDDPGRQIHDEHGQIAEWTMAPNNQLVQSITVVWDNGLRTVHDPMECELSRRS